MQLQTLPVIISSGSLVSSPVPLQTSGGVGLIVPNITSAQLFVQAAFDTVSASFARAWRTDGSSTYVAAVGSTPAALDLSDVVRGFPYVRLETSVAQTDNRSFTMTFRGRP